jgi:hypothetical protein
MSLVSDCCGAFLSNGDNDSEDMEICPQCLEHCSYIREDEDDEEIASLDPGQDDEFDNNYNGHDI